MYCVLAMVALYAGLAHSFSWEIVAGIGKRLEFIDNNATITHTEKLTLSSDTIYHTTYDPVRNRVLFTDFHNIFSFYIGTNKTECLMTVANRFVSSLAYDPATELLFWAENYENIYSMSLKSEFNNSKVVEKHLIWSGEFNYYIAIDSCGGLIYWTTNYRKMTSIYRARFDGSKKEVVVDNADHVTSLIIDQHSQKMFFSDLTGSIKSADLNGKNIKTILRSTKTAYCLTVSKDSMYWHPFSNPEFNISQILKNPPPGVDAESKVFIAIGEYFRAIAANYNIEDITKENQNCDTLKSLLRNNSVSTDDSLLCVHGTKVSGESRCECTQGYSGERCDVSVCHNYCLRGDCNASADGQPKCRCNPGFSGERCELNVCQGYCLNDGVCSLSEESKPLCWCIGDYDGERCEFSVFLIKCSQTISMLREILYTDVTSQEWVKSSCASTAV